MALAVVLMVAVSIPSIHQSLFDDEASSGDIVDYFPAGRGLELLLDQDDKTPSQAKSLGTHVNWTHRKTDTQFDQF
jgi:hypothetical protein